VPDTDTAVADPIAEELEPATEQAPAAATPAKPAKDKKDKDKGKKDKKDKGAAEELPDGPTIAGHPRAVRSVARAKAWGALVGFILGGYLSLPTHTVADAGLRALIAGAALYVAAWAGAVFLWRRLVMVEIKAREAQLLAAARASVAARQGTGAPAVGRGGQGSNGN
jgi:hypothetical protein